MNTPAGSVEALDEYFVAGVRAAASAFSTQVTSEPDAERLLALFRAQATSRHTDFAARFMQSQSAGFYTISSAGHEANAALGLLTEVSDPALLHYRSGGLYVARSERAGRSDAARDILLGVAASADDPISGGRHKVFGHPELHIIPQTSTIASHLPRAVGLGFALELAAQVGRETPWPEDAIVLCSFGDASANHSTAVGALNAAGYLTHRDIACPVLFVCEDNGIGISTPTPAGWTTRQLSTLPGIEYFAVDGSDPVSLLRQTDAAISHVRASRTPAVLHMQTVRFLGHAGSDVEAAYRSASEIAGSYERDPLLATARALIAGGARSADDVLAEYSRIGAAVRREAEALLIPPRLASSEAVMAPLLHRSLSEVGAAPPDLPHRSLSEVGAADRVETRSERSERFPQTAPPQTLAQAINATLAAALEASGETLVFGEDVGRKGGVYGVTRGLQKRFGRHRVFDTLLDEQTILGTALGTALAGFTPIPEIQYLAYLHNAEDQLRGEAASLQFFSNGQYRNGMVVRIQGLAYQKGFGGHFHNDNSLAVLRDIPGIVVAVPSNAADAAGMLGTCIDLARETGQVSAFVEPIALYHTRDLLPGDGRWVAPVDPAARIPLGEVAVYGDGDDALIVTYGNGAYLSLRAAEMLAASGIRCRVLDLRWLLPLPEAQLREHVRDAERVLIVDETRHSAGLGDTIRAIVSAAAPAANIEVLSAADSFIPLGPAAAEVLVQEADIIAAVRRLVNSTR